MRGAPEQREDGDPAGDGDPVHPEQRRAAPPAPRARAQRGDQQGVARQQPAGARLPAGAGPGSRSRCPCARARD